MALSFGEPNMANPYEPAESHSTTSKQVRLYLRVLESFKKHRGREIPLFDQIRAYLPQWLFSAIILGGASALILWMYQRHIFDAFPFVAFLVGLYVGRVGRDIAHSRFGSRIWPLVRDVLDWQEVDRKLEELSNQQ